MYIYLDKQGVVKEIINDEALRQSASNANQTYVYYDGLQEADIGSVLATYGLPDGTVTDEMQVATQTQESEIPYNAERDLKYFQYYKAYAFYHFAIADLALSQEGVVRLMIRLAQKDGEYIKVAGLICFDVEGELVKEDHGVSLAQYNYLVKAWINANGFLPLDGSKAMQGNLDMGSHNVLLNGKTLKDNNGALNYNGKDLAKREDVSSLQSQIDTINATQNVMDIVGTKAELNAYATKDLHTNDKIEVLADESQNNANTIYEWNGNAWSLVGSKAPYYSKAESDTRYNELKAKSYDKDTTGYVTGHVPDSALVKGSLDSVNENIGALQTDNQTTKTTIAGLVSSDTTNKANIAKNTQDIENLSAAMPTCINVDAHGYAILEHDGTEITGQKKKLRVVESNFKGSIVREITSESNTNYYSYDFFKTNDTPFKLETYEDRGSYGNTGSFITFTSSFSITNHAPSSLKISFKDRQHSSSLAGFPLEFVLRTFNSSKNMFERFDYVFPEKNGIIALTSDLDAKQSTLYRHTIEITKDNEATLILTTESTISTEINTMDKFISAFKGSELACMCSLYDNNGWNIHYIGIQVGTTLDGTSMMSTNLLDTGMTFTDVFGTSGYTMVDKVKPL